MRAQLVHLSGPRRGRTATHGERLVTVGSEAGCDECFPEGTPGVAPRHAELEFGEEGCAFHLRRRDGEVFVNNREVEEVILHDDDLIEFGVGGPKVRFRLFAEEGAVCKPVRVMLKDARSVAEVSGPVAGAESMTRDLLTQATPTLKIGFPLLVLAIALPLAWVAGWFGAAGSVQEEREELERTNRELRTVVSALQDKLEAAEAAEAMSLREIESLREDFEKRAEVVDRMVRDDSAARRVYNQLRMGVCLIHGEYGFRKDGKWLRSPSGRQLLNEYVGSGFLVRGGWIVTNRHVEAPWVRDDDQAPILAAGYVAEFRTLRVFFPGRDPLDIDPDATVLRDDEVDVALLKCVDPVPEGIPVLELDDSAPETRRGESVLVVGYPTGVNALLAKADPALVERVTVGATDLRAVLDGLAKDRAISPLITGGSLNDITGKRLVYDAETTSGGSGGPVFGRDATVIGVNFAILRDFSGSNLGIPVEFVIELLKDR